MDKIYIICAVCADFFSPGGSIFRITKGETGIVTVAPAWIKDTINYKMLNRSGLVYETLKQENDETVPVETPDENPEIIEEVIEVPATPKKRKKKSDAQ